MGSLDYRVAVGVELRVQEVSSDIDHGRVASFAISIGIGLPIRCP